MGKWIEWILPIAIGVICTYILNKFGLISYKNSVEIIKNFPTIGTCFFGFLLTMFSIIIQGSNKTTDIMRKDKRLFKRFVGLNVNVVLLSLIVTIYSYLIGNMKVQYCHLDTYLNTSVSVFYTLFIAFIIANIYFLAVFYILVLVNLNEEKDD